jgi:hypothetical protein
MRALKQEVLDRRREAMGTLPRMLLIMLAGFVLVIVAGVIESVIQGRK